jgi:hypothetical protein
MSLARNLSRTLGGIWTWDGRGSWWCDDATRHVSRCSAGVDEFDNEVGLPQYWLYGDGTPRRAEGYVFAKSKLKLWRVRHVDEGWDNSLLCLGARPQDAAVVWANARQQQCIELARHAPQELHGRSVSYGPVVVVLMLESDYQAYVADKSVGRQYFRIQVYGVAVPKFYAEFW